MPPIHVYDTYARSSRGAILHFDVALTVKDDALALQYAREWLASIGHPDAQVGAENCCFCHTEAAAPPQMQQEIEEKGYAIHKLEGCPR